MAVSRGDFAIASRIAADFEAKSSLPDRLKVLRRVLGLSNKPVPVEAAVVVSVMNETLRSCPFCGNALGAHSYRLIASSPITPERLGSLQELLLALREQNWQKAMTHQSWEGSEPNAEIFGIGCPENGYGVIVVLAPVVLEEPYIVAEQVTVENPAAFEPFLPVGDSWHLF